MKAINITKSILLTVMTVSAISFTPVNASANPIAIVSVILKVYSVVSKIKSVINLVDKLDGGNDSSQDQSSASVGVGCGSLRNEYVQLY